MSLARARIEARDFSPTESMDDDREMLLRHRQQVSANFEVVGDRLSLIALRLEWLKMDFATVGIELEQVRAKLQDLTVEVDRIWGTMARVI